MLDAKALGENIKKYRRSRKMTQRELAQALFLTAQTVSKWEKGSAYPDLENLCRLAGLLEVSMDLLLEKSNTDSPRALIGIDGGGTKTEFVLFLESGEVLSRFVLGGSNPNTCTMAEACRVLKTGIDILLSTGAAVSGMFLGIAGSSSGQNGAVLSEFLKKNYPMIENRVASDIMNVFGSVRGCEKCIAAICGTGSVLFGNDGKEIHRAGGWGYLFDGAGSGFDIGRDALEYCLRYETGLCAHSVLIDKVTEKLGKRVLASLDELYSRGNEYIASFAPLVFEAYAQGDAAAEEIIRRTMERIAYLAGHLHSSYDCGNSLILAGGLTAYREVFEKMLLPMLPAGMQLLFPDLPPIYGACLCAMKHFGPKEYDEKRFDEAFFASYLMLKEAPKGEKTV